MKIYRIHLLAAVAALLLLFPMHALAESADSLRIDEAGAVTIVSLHAAADGVSSLQFSLTVDAANGANVEFQFAGSAKIQEYRYDGDTKRLNIYIAGTEALFAEGTDTLTVGKVVVSDGNGGSASATLSVVEDSLQYVYGTELRTMEDLEVPGKVQIGAPQATNPPQVTNPPQTTEPPQATPEPQPAQNPENTGNQGGQSGNTGSQGGNAGNQGSGGNQGNTGSAGGGTQGNTGSAGGGSSQGDTGSAGGGSSQGDTGSAGGGSSQGGTGSAGGGSSQGSTSSGGSSGSHGGQGNAGSGAGQSGSASQPGGTSQGSGSSEEPDGSTPETDTNPGESEEVFSESGLNPSEDNTDQPQKNTKDSNGIDWIVLLVIGAALLFVAVAVMAVVVLNRKPKMPNIWDEE